MKFKNIFILITVLSIFLVGCSNNDTNTNTNAKEDLENLNETGMPIVKESIEVEVFAPESEGDKDWNDILIWNDYKEKTNIDVNWRQVPVDSLTEKRNLTLASDDIPDAFYAAGLGNLDIFKYGQQGTFIPLNDLIEEHAPNLSALMEEYPEVRQSITFPDGNIYSMPTIQDPEFTSLLLGARPWFNSNFLEELDMDMPETTDEFYDYLVAVKNTDLDGKDKADLIPYAGERVDHLIEWLRGAFGLSEQNHKFLDLEDDGETIRFNPISNDYKEMLTYVNKLYEEELINQNIFTIEKNQFLASGSEGIYGSTSFFSPDKTFDVDEDLYIGGLPLEGPEGDQSYSKSNAVGRVDGLVITKANQDPAAMVRWLDFFYTEEGSRYQYMGIEGETYEVDEDGTYEYVEEITDNPDGLTLDNAIRKKLAWIGIFPPGVMREEYFMGTETSKASLEAADKIEPYLTEESWPLFMYTEDETKVISSTGADIEKYVEEMRDKFIAGNESLDDWDSYVETIENMGLDEYLEVQQAAYDRYKENE